MFTLRRITGDQAEINHVLGDSYTYVNQFRNEERFCENFVICFGKRYSEDEGARDARSDDEENCYAFISANGHLQPLYKNQKNFIMTSDGRTFDNISYK